jgi:hypothetical protein
VDKMGVSRTKTTILNLLEYTGTWEWYDRQVKLSQGTLRTKRNKPVDRGASIHVLNELQKMKSIKGVGRLALEEGGSMSDTLPENCDSISERAKMRHLHVLLNRGSKLKERLAKELGLGIYSAQQFGEQCDPG